MNYAIYDQQGSIIKTIECSENSIDAQLVNGEQYLQVDNGVFDDTHYIKNGDVIERAAMDITVVVTGLEARVSGVPVGATLQISSVSGVVDDPQVIISVEESGTYLLTITSEPDYLLWESEVTFE